MSADQVFDGGQYNLGVLYDRGRGVPQDSTEAAKWYRLASDQGNAVAQNLLGAMYLEDRGVPKSYTEALK
jgi:TPR repeat protein